MAITTLDGLVAGMRPSVDVFKVGFTAEAVGILQSSWYLAGLPGAATAPATGVDGALLTSPTSGQIEFPATVAGQDIYLARFEAVHAASMGGVTLADRIWHNSGLVLTTTTAQTIAQPTPLDRDGVFDGTFTGFGVQVGIEVHTAALNNAGAITNTTLSYTNEAGTAGRTGTIPSFPASAALGAFVPFALQAGDKGVRSIQSITLGTSYGTTGGISLVMYRQVVAIGTPLANIVYERDGISLGLPRMHPESVPFLLIMPAGGVSVGLQDYGITWAQG